jgi:hypothetical protein
MIYSPHASIISLPTSFFSRSCRWFFYEFTQISARISVTSPTPSAPWMWPLCSTAPIPIRQGEYPNLQFLKAHDFENGRFRCLLCFIYDSDLDSCHWSWHLFFVSQLFPSVRVGSSRRRFAIICFGRIWSSGRLCSTRKFSPQVISISFWECELRWIFHIHA